MPLVTVEERSKREHATPNGSSTEQLLLPGLGALTHVGILLVSEGGLGKARVTAGTQDCVPGPSTAAAASAMGATSGSQRCQTSASRTGRSEFADATPAMAAGTLGALGDVGCAVIETHLRLVLEA